MDQVAMRSVWSVDLERVKQEPHILKAFMGRIRPCKAPRDVDFMNRRSVIGVIMGKDLQGTKPVGTDVIINHNQATYRTG